ncbi:MAG: hypothetical protein ABI627_23635 [Polyangiaceae bacterium]
MPDLTFLKQRLGGPRARRVQKYVGIAVLALLGLELAYLLVANVLLGTGVIPSEVNSAKGVQLEYATAHSWLPGRVQVRGLDLRVEDYNVQFELRIERAHLEVSLHDLLAKQFHASHLRAEGLSFRMRHKVHAVGSNAARLAAYPSIRGFADPPLYRGPPPPPTTTPEALWSIQIDDVVAKVNELWVLEYRFRGDAEARGSFLLRPALQVQVEPAELDVHSGSLQAGTYPVSEHVHGKLSFDMPNLDVRSTEGNALFRAISAGGELDLAGVELGFLNLYLPQASALRPSGSSHLRLAAEVKQGRLTTADTTLEAPKLTLESNGGTLVGKARVSAVRHDESEPLKLSAHLEQATFGGQCEKPATVKAVDAALDLTRVDLTRPIETGAISVAGSVQAPDIACFDALISKPDAARYLGGSADASFQMDRDASKKGNGQAELDLRNGSYQAGDTHFHSDLHATARFRLDEDKAATAYAQGAVSVRLSSADSLLSVAVAPLFQKLIAGTLGLDELSATVAFHAQRDAVQLALTSLESGAVDAKGHLHVPLSGAGAAQGAVLFSSGPIHVGVKLQGSSTAVEPLVSEDWLEPSPG